MESTSLSMPVSNSMTHIVTTKDEKPMQPLTKIQIPLKTTGLILILTTLTLMLFGYTLIALLIIVPLRNLIQMMSNGKDMFFRLASVRKDGKHVLVPRIFHHQQ
jgi:type IV secretory pathway VirB3-like protein